MAKLRFDVSMSVDGFIAGPNETTPGRAGGGTIRRSARRSSCSRTTSVSRSRSRAARRSRSSPPASSRRSRRPEEAAAGKDVSLGGGANVIQQYLAAGLVDELQLNVVPIVLGDGTRLFDNIAGAEVKLEPVRVVEAPDVTHLSTAS